MAESGLQALRRMPRLGRAAPVLAVVGLLVTTPVAAQRADTAEALADAGWSEIGERRYGPALDSFTRAIKLAPRDADPLFGAGVAAAMLGRYPEAREWLERALAADARLTEASVLLGEVHYREGHVDEAIDAYEKALVHAPGHSRLTQTLERWRNESRMHGRFYQAQGAHFSVIFEGPSDDVLARRIVELLEQAYYRIGSALSIYPTRPITVVLYTQEQFRDVTRSPAWASGAYDGRIKVPVRGAGAQPENLQRVLEHELVHAMVATLAGSVVPAWLNEGLATVLERDGLEWAQKQLASDRTRTPYAGLTEGFVDLPPSHVAAAYAQSAIAVKKMLDLRGTPAVVALLRALGNGASFDTAFHQTIAMRFVDFATMLERE